MKLRLTLSVTVMATLCLVGVAPPRAAAQSKPLLSEQAFKNIQVLKGITTDDFMATMGLMSGGLGFDCSECHTAAGTDKVDWAADTPRKIMARRMVTMVQGINKQNFGSQMVTCWTCHRGRDRPATTESLETVYGPGPTDREDVLTQAQGEPTVDQLLNEYLTAIGGQQKLATIKSYIASGTSMGFGGFGGGATVHIYGKFPNQRTTLIEFKKETGRGDSTRTTDGKVAWIKTPLNILGEFQAGGGELDGAIFDAELAFPAQIKNILGTHPRVSYDTTISDIPGPSSQTDKSDETTIGQDRPVDVLQGEGPRGILVTLYFDRKTHLLVRMVRSPLTPIGRENTQIDFGDYRDVNGMKFPFRLLFAWLDGRDAFQLNQIQLNVPVSDAMFGKPSDVLKQPH